MAVPPLPTAPTALEPIWTCSVNERVLLHKGRVRVLSDSHAVEGNGSLYYTWQPHDGPELDTDVQLFTLRGKLKVEFDGIGLVAMLSPRRSTWGTAGSGLVGILSGEVEFGNFANVIRIAFHIGNFLPVLGAVIQRGSMYMRARMEWRCPPWHVTIDPVAEMAGNGSKLAEKLDDQRGRAITHCGNLSRTDGAVFGRDEALDVLRDIGRTLSFACGAFSTPLLLAAYDQGGNNVWQCWSAFRTDPWNSHATWFSKNKPEILESVFVGWRALSTSPNREIINAAAHIYLDAHAPALALESQLVLLQSALEGLADGWPYPPLPSAPAIPSMNSRAAVRIANVAVSLGLPLSVDPVLLPNLAALPLPSSTAPALEKMAWVRNSIAHLDNLPRMAPYDWRLKFEAKQLAALHLELAILRLLEASGQYLNRLSAQHYGQEAKLPWQ